MASDRRYLASPSSGPPPPHHPFSLAPLRRLVRAFLRVFVFSCLVSSCLRVFVSSCLRVFVSSCLRVFVSSCLRDRSMRPRFKTVWGCFALAGAMPGLHKFAMYKSRGNKHKDFKSKKRTPCTARKEVAEKKSAEQQGGGGGE